MDMFRDLTTQMSDRKTSILNDPNSWHNVFLREVTQRVDESVFAPLFNQGGRPNSPLRVLLAMMVLKEGNGWSDEQLFDNCRFNIRCMRALGLCHIDDDIPGNPPTTSCAGGLASITKCMARTLSGRLSAVRPAAR